MSEDPRLDLLRPLAGKWGNEYNREWRMEEFIRFFDALGEHRPAAEPVIPRAEVTDDGPEPIDWWEQRIPCSCGKTARLVSRLRADSAEVCRIECDHCRRAGRETWPQTDMSDLVEEWAALATPAPKDPWRATQVPEVKMLREALTDMLAGWRYIRQVYGDLRGVGWDRCQQAAETAIASPSVSESTKP